MRPLFATLSICAGTILIVLSAIAKDQKWDRKKLAWLIMLGVVLMHIGFSYSPIMTYR
jgi:hypothetical protein